MSDPDTPAIDPATAQTAEPAPEAVAEAPATSAPASGALIRAAGWLYPATTFLSAGLLFTLQPLFAKMLTPLMGGTPAVWNTALVFYQAALLAGYLYAHLIATRLTPRAQFMTHAAVLALGALFLPIGISEWAGAPDVSQPVVWTLSALALSIAAPIIAISATAPLIQSWRARLGDAVDPYRLYAASNLGSFAALAAYPFLIEPMLGAQAQSIVWACVYAILAVALLASLAAVPKDGVAPREVAAAPTTWRQRLIWFACAAPPSALLVAVTTHLTTDVASVPLLWIPPLALFLLTFVIAFSAIGDRVAEGAAPLKFMVVFLLAALMAADRDGGFPGLALHLAAFFVIVLCCHLELARRRPEPAHLTEFYLWMSFGGVVGGALAALAAPVLLDTTIEYPIALAAALAVAPWGRLDWRWAVPAVLTAGLAVGLYLWRADLAGFLTTHVPVGEAGRFEGQGFWYDALLVWNYLMSAALLCAALAVAATLASRSAPLVAAFGALALMIPLLEEDGDGVKFRERSFFGVLEVEDTGEPPTGWRYLSHGTTLHGVMSLDPARNREPMSYYYRETPIGLLFQEASDRKPTDLHAGVVGLGMGSTTCYAKPGQNWKVFEIDEDVVKAAMDPELVGFVGRCAPQTQIIMGDARLKLAEQPDDWFDILLIDAFSSDAIPTHMITKEAIATFMKKVRQDGILIVHISNRYLALDGIVADAAQELGYVVMEGDRDGEASNPNADTGVRAMVIAKEPARLARYQGPIWRAVAPSRDPKPWTDDHTDILRAIFEE